MFFDTAPIAKSNKESHVQAGLAERAVPDLHICSLVNAKALSCQLCWAFPHCCHEGISKLFREACSFWQSVNEQKTFFGFGSGSSCT